MDLMNRHDYYYELPQDRIAQEPLEPRDHSRMLVLNRSSGSLQDKHFYDLCDFLRPGDCLIPVSYTHLGITSSPFSAYGCVLSTVIFSESTCG